MTMGDKIVVMKDGIIQQIGAPLELYNSPVNRFVAGFIGSPPMNILSANIKDENGNIIADEGSFQVTITGKDADHLRPYVGKPALFGVRPEDLVFKETEAKENNIKAKVEVVEPLGAEVHLYVSTEDHQIIVRTPPRHDFKVDEQINLTPDLSRVHFFDAETEKVIY
jgi:multiple sugar transport system ATP-binding protein